MYLLNMASLTAKVVHGRRYYQIITSQRVNGKPRQIVLAHLGTADTLLARLRQKPGEPVKARIQQFGFLAAAWGLAQRLQFVSFLDSRTTSELAQRGHAKSKRTDLRVVGLALLVSTDFHIPLFSRVYPGNQPDSVTFRSVTEELIERYRVLAKNLEHVTLVFDKGNNSAENLAALGPSPYHVVGSLVPTQHPDLLEVPLDKF